MKEIIEGLETEIGSNTEIVQTLETLLHEVASDLADAKKKLEALTTAHQVLTGKHESSDGPVLGTSPEKRAHSPEAPRRLQEPPRLEAVPTPITVDQGPPCPSCGATKLFRTARKLSNGRTVNMTACGECSTELLG